MIERDAPDLVFLDIKMPGLDGLEALQRIRQSNESLPVVIISGHGTVSTAVEATKLGAFDFIEKPLASERVLVTIRNALDQTRLQSENRTLKRAVEARHQMVGESAALRQIWDAIKRAAPTNATVLLLGESGAGKELVARVDPSQQPAQPRALRAGQLRGDSRRADRVRALRPREGLVHRRHREADRQVRAGGPRHDLPRRSRRHERRRRRPRSCACCRRARSSGSAPPRTIKVDVRVIAATNKDLEAGDREGHLPRGSVLPPQRHPDPRAAAARAPRGHPGAGPAFRRPLQPGEQPQAAAVHAGGARASAEGALEGQRPRAAEHRRAAADHDAWRRIDVDDLRDVVRADARPRPAGSRSRRRAASRPGTLREFKESAERKFLVEKLRENAWNISKTAEVIGTPRSNLYKKLEQYAITQESDG